MDRGRSRMRWWVAVLLAVAATGARAQTADEAELKAAYLLNFAMFVEWPGDETGTFNICQYGSDTLGSGASALARRTLHGRPIAVHKVTEKNMAGCDLLFIPAADQARIRDLTYGLRGSHVLTVSDAHDAARQGAAIGLAIHERRIVFEVNVAEARRNRLVISAKLLRLAQSVLDAP